MTGADLKKLAALVNWRVGRYRSHRDWEDIQQEAMIAAWQALARHRATGGEAAESTVIVNAAWWGALTFLRHRATPGCRYRRPEAPPEPEVLSWEVWSPAAPPVADFAPALIERLAEAAFVRDALARCTPLQRQTILACSLHGKLLGQYAAEQGVTLTAVIDRLNGGLNRTRRHYGLPDRRLYAGRNERSHCQNGHEMMRANQYFDPSGQMRCRTCMRAARAADRARRKEKQCQLSVSSP